MSNEEMDEAIAIALGWKLVDVPDYLFGEIQVKMWQDPTGKRGMTHPCYSTDLNAMREAEQALFVRDWGLRSVFIDNLCRIVNPARGYWMQRAKDIIDATALDHAKAFIETIKPAEQ